MEIEYSAFCGAQRPQMRFRAAVLLRKIGRWMPQYAYSEPDRNNQNNYMLDTCACNHIVESAEKWNAVKKSVSYGFCYYSTALQDMEFAGKGAKTYNKDCISVSKFKVLSEFKEKIEMLYKELNVKLVPEIACAMRDHTRVDGTNRFLAPDSLGGQVHEEVVSQNKADSKRPYEHSYDAMIAEAAIYHGCVLVSDDGPLRNKVNLMCAGKVITTDELVEIINGY